MSSNESSTQTNISTDRDDHPGATQVHEGAPAPEDVERPAPTPQGTDAAAHPTANIGVVGLAVMGSNLARNLASREGNTVAIFNRSHAKTETLIAGRTPRRNSSRHRRTRSSPPRCRSPAPRSSWSRPGAGTDAVIDALVSVFEPGDIIVDGGNALLHRHHPPREGRPRDRHQLRRRRHLRRRRGRTARPVDHARRIRRVVGDPRSDPQAPSRRSPRASRASRTSATTAPGTS